MLNRRELLGGCSALALLRPIPASAIIPAIVAALATIALIATATAKAADAIDKAVASGQSIWTRVSGMLDRHAAAEKIGAEQARLAQEAGIRREVIARAATSQQLNAVFVDQAYRYVLNPQPTVWLQVRDAIKKASDGLGSALSLMRTNAVWFPADAQDALAALPSLYEKRGGILSELMALPGDGPPADDVRKLADGYDTLRVQSLKLLKALDAYTKAA